MLETKIDELVAALNANTAALSKIGAAAKAATGGATATTKPATTTKPAAAKAPTTADLQNAFGQYLTHDDAAERDARKANVKAMIAHFGVDKMSNLDAARIPEALAMLKQFEAGENPLGGEEADESLV